MESLPASGCRILLVNQEPVQGPPPCAQLALAGFEVLEVSDHIEALAAVRGQQVDLVLLHMPLEELEALDLANVMRELSPASYLPVVILAESPTEQQLCRFLDYGADEILSATVSGPLLAARLRALLRVRGLHQELAASRASLAAALSRERKLLAKLRRDNAHLQALVTTDPLTRVQNVRSFQDILWHEFKVARRYGHPLSLLMLDVDHFKLVNDTFGHPTGDFVLKELAVILKRSVRESDVVARVGGEEFAVILPQAGPSQAALFAERIRNDVAECRFCVYGRQLSVTISIGSCSLPAAFEVRQPEMLVYLADQALLAAKEAGRNKVVALEEMEPAVRLRLRRQYELICQEQAGLYDAHPARQRA